MHRLSLPPFVRLVSASGCLLKFVTTTQGCQKARTPFLPKCPKRKELSQSPSVLRGVREAAAILCGCNTCQLNFSDPGHGQMLAQPKSRAMHLHHIINHIGDKAFRGPSRVLQGGAWASVDAREVICFRSRDALKAEAVGEASPRFSESSSCPCSNSSNKRKNNQ